MKSQQAVLDYKYLDGYYTYNGFNSAEYNYAISNPDVSERYSNSVLELYRTIIHCYVIIQVVMKLKAQWGLHAHIMSTNYYCK